MDVISELRAGPIADIVAARRVKMKEVRKPHTCLPSDHLQSAAVMRAIIRAEPWMDASSVPMMVTESAVHSECAMSLLRGITSKIQDLKPICIYRQKESLVL
jgi:hypothetical protein